MHLPRFQYARPDSRAAAAGLLAKHGAAACLVAGGTDLFPRLKYGLGTPEWVVSLKGVAPAPPKIDAEGRLVLDALTTLAAVARSPEVLGRAPLLADAALCVASGQIRNAATLGGNLCLEARCLYYNQSHTFQFVEPCLKRGGDLCYFAPKGKKCFAVHTSDTAPALLCLDAEVEVVGASGSRRFPLEQLYSGDALKPLALAPDEIVAELAVPASPGRRVGAYRKHSRRKGLEFAGLTVAVAVDLAGDGRTCASARVAVGSVAGAPLRAKEAEAALAGKDLGGAGVVTAAARAAAAEIRPFAHHGYGAAHLRHCLEVETRRALETALAQATEKGVAP